MNESLKTVINAVRAVTDGLANRLTRAEKRIPEIDTGLNKRGSAADSAAVGNAMKSANVRISNAQTAADNAQTAADNAQTAADNAQTAADNANYVFNMRISDAWGYPINMPAPQNGKVYTFIPTANSNNSGAAYVVCGSKRYQVRAGITKSKNGIYNEQFAEAERIFIQDIPLHMMFSSANSCFYLFSMTPFGMPVQEAGTLIANDVPKTIYGTNEWQISRRYKYMRVKSSTEGSTKLFDIQVDDNGTITAVEVT